MQHSATRVVIIGAGIGGLAAALRLSHAGCDVTVVETQATPGGKMRTLPSQAGPVDAGPTVLTLRPVFEALFADVGLHLADHIQLTPLDVLARHFWPDGTQLDLMADTDHSASNIANAFGPRAADQFRRFHARTARLFAAFEKPMMLTPAPRPRDLTMQVLRQPSLIPDMAPHHSLARMLRHSFDDPRLAQLFGRYATYVGGSPFASPAILSLIWTAEARGVWTVRGGMHKLAQTLAQLASDQGAQFLYNTSAQRITRTDARVTGVETAAAHLPADMVLFNGDPRALSSGLLGDAVTSAVTDRQVTPRSLSACVDAFAAAPSGIDLAHHNVFFADNEQAEFDALTSGTIPTDATLYLCAQDHGTVPSDALQRFEIIRNAPPIGPQEIGKAQCQTLIFDRLRRFGLSFDRAPNPDSLTLPQGFDHLFPASQGSLYGRSPQGMMAAFQRPTARTPIPGLYLCGGGAHPGAGVPMATLSARHAAEAMLSDQTLISASPRTAMRGGTLTGSRTTARAASRSSAS